MRRAGVRIRLVEDRVEDRVRNGADFRHHRRAPLPPRGELSLGLLGGAGVEHDERSELHLPTPSGAWTSPAKTVRSSETLGDVSR